MPTLSPTFVPLLKQADDKDRSAYRVRPDMALLTVYSLPFQMPGPAGQVVCVFVKRGACMNLLDQPRPRIAEMSLLCLLVFLINEGLMN
jgi:hypothetical protein